MLSGKRIIGCGVVWGVLSSCTASYTGLILLVFIG